MARSGSENRERQISLKARFTAAEAELVRVQAERAGVSVAAVIRHAVLGQTPLRASRGPSIDKALAAQLLAALGGCATALRDAAGDGADDAVLDAAHRDLAEMRCVLFEALGRLP